MFMPEHCQRCESVVSPKPWRVGLLSGSADDLPRPPRRHLSHEADLSDSKARSELLDIILTKINVLMGTNASHICCLRIGKHQNHHNPTWKKQRCCVCHNKDQEAEQACISTARDCDEEGASLHGQDTYGLFNILIPGANFFSAIENASWLSTCVRRPKFILCSGGSPSGYIPIYAGQNTTSSGVTAGNVWNHLSSWIPRRDAFPQVGFGIIFCVLIYFHYTSNY